jgi:subtilisin family serine protease
MMLSIFTFSVNSSKELKAFQPSKSFFDIVRKPEKSFIKRVIAEDLDLEGVKNFRRKGCIVKHRLKGSISFDCPKEVVSSLGARESRVFHIVDLEADQFIGADLVWAEGITGNGVNVVILDTGIDASHNELWDSISGQYDFVDNDYIAEDPNGHGTHVAGIITAKGYYKNVVGGNDLTGVAPGSGIYMLRVCDSSGSCLEDDMMAAMELAVESLDARIMSISIGGGNYRDHCDTDPLAAKVNWVVENGYSVTVANGNDGLGVSSPACASKAIAVGVVDKSGVLPYWSNRGTAVDIVAPGVDILSTYSCLAAGDCSADWYASMSGTSMSTPHVSGVLALLLDAAPTLTDSEIKDALYTSASPVSQCFECTVWFFDSCLIESEVACTVDVAGAGIVNAYGAYQHTSTTSSTTTTTLLEDERGKKKCSDGIDNDGDGLVDGDDSDCQKGGGGPPSNESENSKKKCKDGIDNDGDGLVDGDDPDCSRWV